MIFVVGNVAADTAGSEQRRVRTDSAARCLCTAAVCRSLHVSLVRLTHLKHTRMRLMFLYLLSVFHTNKYVHNIVINNNILEAVDEFSIYL